MNALRAMAAMAALCLCHGATAQALLPSPVETPGEGFTLDRYIDTGGCVFIRVGLGEQEIWAPRYRSDGGQDCGHLPSVSEAGAEEKASARARPVTGLAKPGYYIQAGAFGKKSNIERISAGFNARGWGAANRSAGRLTLLFAGPFDEALRAQAALRSIRRSGMPDAYLVVQEVLPAQ